MRYLILFLVLLNVVVFLLPKESQRTVHTYTRGEPTVPMLERLDEQDSVPTKTSLVAPGMVKVAERRPVEAEGGKEPVATPDDAAMTTAEAETTGPGEEEPAVGDEAGMAGIESQGQLDKAPDNEGDSGIASVEPPESGAIARGPLQCFSLGPFRQRKEAEKLMAKMVKKGVKPELRTAKVREPSAYWVYLPPYPSRQMAVEAVDRLQALGFDDFYIVGEPKYNNAISLGLFSRKSGSKQRVADLKEMGFEATVETRYAENDVYWVDYASHGEIDWKPLYQAFKDAETIRNVKRDCE